MRTILMALIIGLFSGDAIGQILSLCDERSKVVANLKRTYSEIPVSMGLGSNGALIEILVSPAGTFTIIRTSTEGWSCVIAAGGDWENHRPPPGFIPLKGVAV